MSKITEHTPNEFYEKCLDIFGDISRLRKMKNQLNQYFQYTKFFVHKNDALAVEDDDSAIRFTSFEELEEYLLEQIEKEKDQSQPQIELDKLVHSLISVAYNDVSIASFKIEKIKNARKDEIKTVFRAQRLKKLGEELIQKYGEDKIIIAEKFFANIDIPFPVNGISNGIDILYALIQEYETLSLSEPLLDLDYLCYNPDIANMRQLGFKNFLKHISGAL